MCNKKCVSMELHFQVVGENTNNLEYLSLKLSCWSLYWKEMNLKEYAASSLGVFFNMASLPPSIPNISHSATAEKYSCHLDAPAKGQATVFLNFSILNLATVSDNYFCYQCLAVVNDEKSVPSQHRAATQPI